VFSGTPSDLHIVLFLNLAVQAYLTVTDSQGESSTSNPVSITVKPCSQLPVAKLSGGAVLTMSSPCSGTAKVGLDGEYTGLHAARSSVQYCSSMQYEHAVYGTL
jgi:hypothetical protein